MRRPWTPSKKKLPEFDSFLAGSGPKYVKSREEKLGGPLTKKEINSCKKTTRQLNIGRDGLTHNMLGNIHAHWKRKRVCKIKCKGVCTVDMDNICDMLRAFICNSQGELKNLDSTLTTYNISGRVDVRRKLVGKLSILKVV